MERARRWLRWLKVGAVPAEAVRVVRRHSGWAVAGALAGSGLVAAVGVPVATAAGQAGSAAPRLTASFQETSSWVGGYVGRYTITNVGTSTTSGWQLRFQVPAGATLVNWWDGSAVTAGGAVSVTNAPWDGSLAPGASAGFGFQVAVTGGTGLPTGCLVGSAPCTGAPSPVTTTTTATTTTGTSPPTSTTTTTTGRPTTSTTVRPAATTTTTAPNGAVLRATLEGVSTWPGGYSATFVVANIGSSPVTSWHLGFELPAGQQLVNSWNGVASTAGQSVSVSNASWDGLLGPAGSATFGFQVSATGPYSPPFACRVDGGACSGAPVPATTTTTAPTTTTTTTTGPSGPPPSQGATVFAPYVDMTLQRQDLASLATASGAHSFTLAFVVSEGACTPAWGGVMPVGSAGDYVGAAIGALRQQGGSPVISFGGEAGTELALSCSSASQLEAAYQKVVDTYHVYDLDFDIEGAAVADSASVAMRSQAIAQLQRAEAAAGHHLDISLTLPVLPTGFPPAEMAVVRSAVRAGVQLSVVNAMTMDYGGAVSDPGLMGTYADQAAAAVETQLAGVYPSATTNRLWAMVGVTPLIGQNDVPGEVFTLDDAGQVAAFAAAHGIGRLSMWSATRDQQCPQGVITYDSPTCSGVLQSPWAFSRALAAG